MGAADTHRPGDAFRAYHGVAERPIRAHVHLLGPAEAALYKPDSGPAPHVALVVVHRTADFMRHPACAQLAQRGFLMLCVNTRYTNNEELVRFEEMALDGSIRSTRRTVTIRAVSHIIVWTSSDVTSPLSLNA
jgi:hypothetical protein